MKKIKVTSYLGNYKTIILGNFPINYVYKTKLLIFYIIFLKKSEFLIIYILNLYNHKN